MEPMSSFNPQPEGDDHRLPRPRLRVKLEAAANSASFPVDAGRRVVRYLDPDRKAGTLVVGGFHCLTQEDESSGTFTED